MSESKNKLNQLQTRLDNLAKYEAAFKREIADIRREINILKTQDSTSQTQEKDFSKYTSKEEFSKQKDRPKQKHPKVAPQPVYSERSYSSFDYKVNNSAQTENSNIEKYVGKYLISIIGVLITVIGVGIGAKYAIDNNLVSPLARIIFGYVIGFGLIGFAVRLKEKYHTFSSVLLSGGMAIMYLITYFAYSYYSLLSQTSAFMLMVIFTIFTVLSAIIYNQQIIAHIGLVGAYAVPFLLSNDSGRIEILFSYIAIINIGILAVSLKKYWKYLFYNAFIVTWLIYAIWYLDRYNSQEYFSLALTFLSVFFAIFYITFLAYKLIHKKPFKIENVALILQNSFVFFGFGYATLQYGVWYKFLGLFALINALIHFVVASIIYKYKLGDKNAFYLIVALVLTFLTIAVPIQFDGNWITILWIAEAVFLFSIGRIKKIPLFEYFSFPLMTFACVGLLNNWQTAMLKSSDQVENAIYPIINGNFVTSLSVAIGFAIIFLVLLKKRFISGIDESLNELVKYAIPAVFLIVLYNTFRIEIGNYFHYLELSTAIKNNNFDELITNDSLALFNFIWQLNYTMLFLTLLSFINIKYFKSSSLGIINLTLNSIVLGIFLLIGLFILSILSLNYLNPSDVEYFKPDSFYILIRYISFAFVFTLVFVCYRYIKQDFLTKIISNQYLLVGFDLGFYFLLLVIISSELINWSDILGWREIYRLGLSILFSLYAVFLIVLGIIYKKKHLRIFAIVLFGITIFKLFVYDLAELGTISRPIVFVSVGILLLIASFLYAKFKNVIFDEERI